MRLLLLRVIFVLAFTALTSASVAAQGCDDCREIKKELRDARSANALSTVEVTQAAPVVRAVLYWAEGCGHCHEVLDGVLPALQERYGPQLEIRLIEVVTLEDISRFFDVAEEYDFARGRASVPFLLVGDRALMGVGQIERELPGLIKAFLTAGGVDLPAKAAEASSAAAASSSSGCSFDAPCTETSGGAAVFVEDQHPAAALPPATVSSQAPLIAAGSAIGILALLIAATVGIRRRTGHEPRR